MDAVFRTICSSEFSWMKMYKFRLSFHWSLCPSVQLIIFQHWFSKWRSGYQLWCKTPRVSPGHWYCYRNLSYQINRQSFFVFVITVGIILWIKPNPCFDCVPSFSGPTNVRTIWFDYFLSRRLDGLDDSYQDVKAQGHPFYATMTCSSKRLLGDYLIEVNLVGQQQWSDEYTSLFFNMTFCYRRISELLL